MKFVCSGRPTTQESKASGMSKRLAWFLAVTYAEMYVQGHLVSLNAFVLLVGTKNRATKPKTMINLRLNMFLKI